MNKFLLFILFVIFPSLIFAQKNLKKVTVVTNINDTIRGYINDHEHIQNPKTIKIKEDINGEYKTLSATTVKSVEIENGSYFVSKVVTIDKTPFDIEVDNRLDSSIIRFLRDTVFLNALVLGNKASLYSFDDNKNHFFIQMGNDTLQELIYRRYIVNINGKTYEKEDNNYRQQLQELLKDCPAITKKIDNANYIINSLEALVTDYNHTCGAQGNISYKKEKIKGKFGWGPIVGLSKTNLQFDEDWVALSYVEHDLVTQNKLNTNFSVALGIRTQYILPSNKQKLSFLGDVYFNQYKGSESESNSLLPDGFSHKILSFDMSFLKLNFLFRYYLLGKRPFKPFINAGLAYSSILSSSNTVAYSNSTYKNTHDPFVDNGLHKSLEGYVGGAGIAYKKFVLEYRFEADYGIADYFFISPSLNSNSIFFSYIF